MSSSSFSIVIHNKNNSNIIIIAFIFLLFSPIIISCQIICSFWFIIIILKKIITFSFFFNFCYATIKIIKEEQEVIFFNITVCFKNKNNWEQDAKISFSFYFIFIKSIFFLFFFDWFVTAADAAFVELKIVIIYY